MAKKYVGWRGTAGSPDKSEQIGEFVTALTEEIEGAAWSKHSEIILKNGQLLYI